MKKNETDKKLTLATVSLFLSIVVGVISILFYNSLEDNKKSNLNAGDALNQEIPLLLVKFIGVSASAVLLTLSIVLFVSVLKENKTKN